MTYEEMTKISKDFYDTIDFEKFIDKSAYRIDIHDFMDCLEEYYDDNHPELLPPEFEGCFFDFMDDYEFTTYLRDRYGWNIQNEIIEKYYIIW